MARLFIATPVTIPTFTVIKNAISPFIEGNWTLGSNLHLTHLFIGESKEEDYKFKLNIPKEQITIKDFGFFNDKILYLKASSPNINSIYNQLQEKLQIKNKLFTPHITLCRIKKIKDKEALLKAIEKFKDRKFKNDFSVYLYSSTLTPKGPIYKKVYKY